MLPGWRQTLAEATAKAQALIPPGVAGGAALAASSSPTVSAAAALLARIKAGLASLATRGLNAYVAPDAWALRKAASVLASGASKAAKLASEAKDAAVADIKAIAADAWQVAVAPLVLAGLAYLAFNDS